MKFPYVIRLYRKNGISAAKNTAMLAANLISDLRMSLSKTNSRSGEKRSASYFETSASARKMPA